MQYLASITVADDAGHLDKLLKSELKDYSRSQITLTKNKGSITLEFKATDATALRASVVGITKLLNVYEKLSESKL